MKKIALGASILCFVLSGLFAGGAKESAAPTIRFAHTWAGADAKGAIFGPALDKFAAENADKLAMVIETSSGDNMFNKVQVEMAGNNLPDLWTYWGGSRLAPLAEADMLMDVADFLKESKNLKKSDIGQGAWDLYRIGEKVYGIPMEGYVASFIVNSELFKKYNLSYPKTYEDFVRVGKVFQDNGIIPFGMGSQGGNPAHFWFSEVYSQFSGAIDEMRNLPKTNKFDTPNALRTAELMVDMKKQGLYPKDTVANGDWSPAFALYNEGRAAMVYTYPWMVATMSPEMQGKSELIPVPMMPGATKNPKDFISGGAVFGIVVNKASFDDPAKHAALVELLDFLVSNELLNDLIKGGLIPTKNFDMNLSNFNPIMRKVLSFTANQEKVTAHWWNIWNNTAAQVYQSSLDELFAEVITPKQFVAQVQAAFDEK